MKVSVTQSCPTLCDPMDCSPPGSSVYGISRQEYWSGLPFPSPGDLPDPGIEPGYPALQFHIRHHREETTIYAAHYNQVAWKEKEKKKCNSAAKIKKKKKACVFPGR